MRTRDPSFVSYTQSTRSAGNNTSVGSAVASRPLVPPSNRRVEDLAHDDLSVDKTDGSLLMFLMRPANVRNVSHKTFNRPYGHKNRLDGFARRVDGLSRIC